MHGICVDWHTHPVLVALALLAVLILLKMVGLVRCRWSAVVSDSSHLTDSFILPRRNSRIERKMTASMREGYQKSSLGSYCLQMLKIL